MEEKVVKVDVLCIGGGVAGLMAAIRASELGAKVVVAEKGNTLRSGKGATGNDHFLCYIPEVNGSDIDDFIESIMEGQEAQGFRVMGMNAAHAYLGMTFDMVKLWDSWGIPMKYQGKYEFAGHVSPGRLHTHLKYEGQGQKKVLTEQARRRGVEIINRVYVFNLLSDERLIGALGISTREDELIEFEAKSVILGTGGVTRLYPVQTPGWFSNRRHPTSLTGDGRIMAYRVGAELRNPGMPGTSCGPKYFVRAGKGTWIGVLRDPQGKPIGPFLTKPERKYSDMTGEVGTAVLADYIKSGKGPIYMDCTGISDADYKYMIHWFEHEGDGALVDHLKGEGIDLRRHPIEFMIYDGVSSGSIGVNDKCETSVEGLYAAGDEIGGGISHAAVFGWIAGENAANYAKGVGSLTIKKAKAKVEEWKRLLEEIRSHKIGPDWKEVNIALQQVMRDYAGNARSEALLKAGLNHLRRLKDKAYATMVAKNQHELGRGLEVLNLFELGKLIFIAADARKETRGRHIRPDYPLTNPQWNNKTLIVKKVDGKLITEWRR